ncbi:hypothetical protein BS17DRAFT_798220 [Gyrodon lividus]|nr:hypothetical protein BS17DRAFT_798220 [Gyrodon lividus]
MKDWNSPIYAFFQPIPTIEEVGGRCSHVPQHNQCTINQKHVRKCWGNEILKAADDVKSAAEVREKIVGSILQTGSTTQAFERKGQGKVTYSHRQHMAEIVRWVLMKTGRPEHYIPSDSTVSHDVWLEYDGKLNFTMDAWTAPNHCVLVAFSVHLEHKGVPLSFLLDVIDVAKVMGMYLGKELAVAFQHVLEEFTIDDKVSPHRGEQ